MAAGRQTGSESEKTTRGVGQATAHVDQCQTYDEQQARRLQIRESVEHLKQDGRSESGLGGEVDRDEVGAISEEQSQTIFGEFA